MTESRDAYRSSHHAQGVGGQDMGPKAAGKGVRVGSRSRPTCSAQTVWNLFGADDLVAQFTAAVTSVSDTISETIGEHDCVYRGAKGYLQPGKFMGCTDVPIKGCKLKRKDIADFLGVADDDEAVKSMVFAQASQITYTISCKVSQVALPFINQMNGGDVLTYGMLRSAQSIAHLGGNVCMGRVADVYGAQAAMLLSHSAAFMYNAQLALATSQTSLLMTTIPCFCMQGFQAAQFVAATRSLPEMRCKALSRTTLAYGVGCAASAVVLVVVGRRVKPRTLAMLAMGMNALFIIVVRRTGAFKGGALKGSTRGLQSTDPASSLVRIQRLLGTPGVVPLLLVKMGVITAGGLVLTMLPQYAVAPFHASAAQIALLIGYRTAAEMATQAYFGQFLDRLEMMHSLDPRSPNGTAVSVQVLAAGGAMAAYSLIAMAAPMYATSLTATPSAHQFLAFAIWVGPLAAAQQVVINTTASQLSKIAPPEDIGLTLGVDWALFSASGIVTPLVSSVLMQRYGFAAVPLAGAGIVGAALATSLYTQQQWCDPSHRIRSVVRSTVEIDEIESSNERTDAKAPASSIASDESDFGEFDADQSALFEGAVED